MIILKWILLVWSVLGFIGLSETADDGTIGLALVFLVLLVTVFGHDLYVYYRHRKELLNNVEEYLDAVQKPKATKVSLRQQAKHR